MLDVISNKYLITGAYGMVGRALRSVFPNSSNIICPSRCEVDFTNFSETNRIMKIFKPDYIIHIAAKVGGIKNNLENLADFYLENIKMNTNILELAYKNKVKKVVSLLSTCIYPDNAIYPLTEDQIHNGPPHPSNYTYAYTKRMLDIQSKAFRDQFGCNFVTVVPNNIYGENDYFDLENSHVIPAIIRKIYEAKIKNTDVYLWGNGKQLREFTYSYDVAKIICLILEEYNERETLNIGNTQEFSILNISNIIANELNFKNKILWNTSQPTGQFRKPSSNEKFLRIFPNFKYTKFEVGIKKTCKWFVDNYPNIRGY